MNSTRKPCALRFGPPAPPSRPGFRLRCRWPRRGRDGTEGPASVVGGPAYAGPAKTERRSFWPITDDAVLRTSSPGRSGLGSVERAVMARTRSRHFRGSEKSEFLAIPHVRERWSVRVDRSETRRRLAGPRRRRNARCLKDKTHPWGQDPFGVGVPAIHNYTARDWIGTGFSHISSETFPIILSPHFLLIDNQLSI